MYKKEPKIICVTPVKNEACFLDRFLKCTSLWADHIIISDQNSTDDSRKIARRYPKVKLITNKDDSYDEKKIRQVTYDEARRINGQRLLIAIDADEIFTPNFRTSFEWGKMLSVSPGTVIKSKFVNLMPDMKHYWLGPIDLPWGFMDDGSEYNADKIHTNRMIYPKNAPVLFLNEIMVIHYQYTDWERMESKHKWYQCWERINSPKKSAVEIYRSYHHMYSVKKSDMRKIPKSWFSEYLKMGIDVSKKLKDKFYYWDKEILEYFKKYGTSFFAREAVWDVNWQDIAKLYGYNDGRRFSDPRNYFQKIIHSWLKKTQYNLNNLGIRIVDKILKKLFGW